MAARMTGSGDNPEPPAERVLEIAGTLYAGLPGDFTAARTEAEKAAKAAGDKPLAAAVKALRKPSVGAWAVNVLVRRESEQIEQVLGLGEALRTAAETLDGAELRELTRQRRRLTSALTTRAGQLALEHGTRLTRAVLDQVEDTLTAAMLDPGSAEAVRSGLLVATLSATGLDSGTSRTDVVALPEALGTRAAPAPAGTSGGGPDDGPDGAAGRGPTLRVVPPNRAVLREAARDRLESAQREHDAARRAAKRADRTATDLQGRRLQLGNEIDELQRRLADAESDLDALEDEIETADDARAETAEAVARTERARDAAQDELDAL